MLCTTSASAACNSSARAGRMVVGMIRFRKVLLSEQA